MSSVVLINRPEAPIVETLEFRTEVITAISGKEQTISLRKYPRRVYSLIYLLDGEELQKFENWMYLNQANSLCMPAWEEQTRVTSAPSSTDTTINVVDTTKSMFRDNEKVIIREDENTYEVLTLSSSTSTTLTFTTGLVNSYSINAEVFPALEGKLRQSAARSQYIRNLVSIGVVFEVDNNVVDSSFPDTTPYSSLLSRVVLDGDNAVVGLTKSGRFFHKQTRLDGQLGVFSKLTDWTTGRRTFEKSFRTHTREDIWKVKRLLYALKGQQKSFFLPNFSEDVTAKSSILSTDAHVLVTNIGLEQDINLNKSPSKTALSIKLKDGTVLTREVQSAVAVDSTTEKLKVKLPWGQAVALADIDVVCFTDSVRFDTDTFEITYNNMIGDASVSAPVRSVPNEVIDYLGIPGYTDTLVIPGSTDRILVPAGS